MKGGWLLTLALLAATSLSGVSADSKAFHDQAMATKDLLGYWSFEGNFADLSPNKNDAKVGSTSDAKAFTFCPGVNGGQGVQIDNASRTNFLEVNSPVGGVFDAPNLTVITWAKIPKAADPGNWDSLVDRNSLWYMETQSIADRDGALGLDFVARIYGPAANGGGARIRDARAYVRENEWHMFAFTYNGKQISTYLDGKEAVREDQSEGVAPTADTPTDPPHGNYNITWGAWEQSDDWFSGCFDDTVIYGRALTAAEMQGLFDAMMAKAQ